MPIDVRTRRGPGWQLHRLYRKLESRVETFDDLYARFQGDAPVPPSLVNAPETAQAFYRTARTGFAEMVVNALKYPIKVGSITTTGSSSETGDPAVHQVFGESGMGGELDDVHRHALVSGSGYGIVGFHEGDPAYTSEDPRQVITIHDPARQRNVLHAAKFYYDDEAGEDVALLWSRRSREYPEGRMWRASRTRATANPGRVRFSAATWDWDTATYGGVDGIPLPAECDGVVPVYRCRNEESIGEFQRHRDLLDRIDHMVLQGMVIATFQAFRQRAIKYDQDEASIEDADGNAVDLNDVLSADPGAVWELPASAELWESDTVDLTPVWTGLQRFTQQLSAVTFTPLAMFSPEGANQSATGARMSTEGRSFKIEDRQDRFAEAHLPALALLLRMRRVRADGLAIQWRPAERWSLAERTDALTKSKTGGVPWETRMRDVMGYDPAQIARMRSQRMDDALVDDMSDDGDTDAAAVVAAAGAADAND